MPIARLTPACLLALLLACGPKSPDGAVTESTGAASETGSRETTTTTTATTSESSTDVAVTTSDVDPLTGTSSPPNPTMSSGTSDETTGTTAVGPCVIDPAAGVCTETCDWWSDCCQCYGQVFLPDPMASECILAMGIVTAACPWRVDDLSMDNVDLPSRDSFECAAAESGWYQEELNGDIIIHLCGQSCADYLAGNFEMLYADVFCEAA